MKCVIKNGTLVNRGRMFAADLLIDRGRIDRIAPTISEPHAEEIDATGLWVLPGIIDDQVHFREPGLTYKATIETESRAAVAGGVTSYMEMPNTVPPATTQELLEDKYRIAALTSAANYSFFMGAANDNLDEVLRTNGQTVCGIKAFLGSSTGNMLVDDPETLELLFSQCPLLIATHCEDEYTIRHRLAKFREQFGDDIPAHDHPIIRNEDACLKSSSMAVELAKKHGTRLHVLHITTADELSLFTNTIPLEQKRITSEVCVHHLWFDSSAYSRLGHQIKCNPAIKAPHHRQALFEALLDDRLDIIATDHAPHTWREKHEPYTSAPSGLPLIQHTLLMMLQFYHEGKITMPRIVEKMCHAPADLFQVIDRGYLDEGYMADIVLLDPHTPQTITNESVLYKCGWTPLDGVTVKGKIRTTFVNGRPAYHEGRLLNTRAGRRLHFNR